ncbi:uncharacterized protein LOC112562599 [Pomacea canaliculata]|uniref:uncharacterized protein LOC112562599 n=1 Tax=Pomacea canaliculata TaxID=400727 RepID=UPI000D731624|nr:uncharacterized protein LOC112562599 [Pomacea canaliculata]XP_025091722.1 uncharacterized protein LOC112562599 [Pomacea canaliculata]
MLRLWCRRPRRCWPGRLAIVVFTGFLVVTNVFFFTDMAGHVGEIKSETDSTYIQDVPMDTPTLDAHKRRERLNAYCDISGGRGEVRPPGDELDFRRGLLVAEKHRLLLCPVGKAASTFLTRFLIALEETNLALSPLQIPPDKAIRVREKYSAYKTLKEFNSAQREKQFLDGLTRVVFVRHPLWRLWSLYVDKLVFPNPYYWRVWGMPAQRRSAVLSAGPGLTGDNFVTRDANRSKHLQNLSPKAPTDLQASRPKEPHRKRSDKKELGLSTDFRLNVSQGDLRDCGQNVRFSEFLDFALEDLHEADWHVRPVSEQCAPCLVNGWFSRDVISFCELLQRPFFFPY